MHLIKLHNYNGVMEIIGALNSGPVSRLQKTWEKISRYDFDTQGCFDNKLGHSKNFLKAYSELMNPYKNLMILHLFLNISISLIIILN